MTSTVVLTLFLKLLHQKKTCNCTLHEQDLCFLNDIQWLFNVFIKKLLYKSLKLLIFT